MWFGAYILIASELPENGESELIVEEPVYLLEAADIVEAEQLAIGIAKKIAETGTSFATDPNAKNVSYGFRKIVEISNPDLGSELPPSCGSEIVYQILKFKNKSDFELYQKNISISAKLIERIE